jgi:hypothetical protein
MVIRKAGKYRPVSAWHLLVLREVPAVAKDASKRNPSKRNVARVGADYKGRRESPRVQPYMIEPLTRFDGSDYAPLCAAIHWITTNGGTVFGRIDDKTAWNTAVGKLMHQISVGAVEIIGRLRDQGLPVRIAAEAFADIPVPCPFPDEIANFTISAESHVSCVPYTDEQHWQTGTNDKLYVQGEQLEAWSRLQVKKSQVRK